MSGPPAPPTACVHHRGSGKIFKRALLLKIFILASWHQPLVNTTFTYADTHTHTETNLSFIMEFKLDSAESFGQLTLGNIRSYKLAGVGKEMFIASIQKPGFAGVVYRPPRFFSSGFVKQDARAVAFAKQSGGFSDRPVITCTKDHTGPILEPLSTKLRDALLGQLREKVLLYKRDAEAAGYKLPQCLEQLSVMGEDVTQWLGIFPGDRDVCFIRVDPHSLVVTEGQHPGVLQQKMLKDFSPSALPGRGFYKVQIGVRYLLIQMHPTANGPQPRVTVNLLINQMGHQPETSHAPQTVVLNLDDMFGSQAGKQMDVVDISDDDDDDDDDDEVVVPVQQQQVAAPVHHKPLTDFRLPVDLEDRVEWGSFIGSLANSTTEEIKAILPPRPEKKSAKKKKVSPPETAQ